MFNELMEGVEAMRDCRCGHAELHRTYVCPAWIRAEGFNPRIGPMQPVTEGLHPMVALDDPILGPKKTD